MKIYLDIGNSNIKLFVNNKLFLYKVTINKFTELIEKYKSYDWIIIITNRHKRKFLDLLNRNHINFKNIVSLDLNNVLINKDININEIGVDILLASKYLNNKNGVIIINGTALISIYVNNSRIESVSIQAGITKQNNFLNSLLFLKNNYKFSSKFGTNTKKAIELGNFFNVSGIINYYCEKYNIQNFVLTGNGFSQSDVNNFLSKKYNIEYVENLVLKMLIKSF